MNEKFFDLKREKQDRIINAALKAFATNSYRHASTDEIVRDADISKGLLFHYFQSKMGLYVFLFDYSVKYILYEYARVISKDEKDYFVIRKNMENAKLNVLKNYPYMNEFIDRRLIEKQLDVIAETEDLKNAYLEKIEEYLNQGQKGNTRPGIKEEYVESIIQFTIDGLTKQQIRDNSYQPQMLHDLIDQYLDQIKIMIQE